MSDLSWLSQPVDAEFVVLAVVIALWALSYSGRVH